MNSRALALCASLVAALSFGLARSVSALTLEQVLVGTPGNAADTGGYGDVSYLFNIGKYEVTNKQYSEFLNSVADTDTNGLYFWFTTFGSPEILRSGSPGSYSYSVVPGRDDRPVQVVAFWHALRFTNWLHNGQPNTGTQTAATTEGGAYTLTPAGMASNSIVRNPAATFFLPSEDEWYKAAYFNGVGAYFDYPAGTDALMGCTAPTATPNRASCAGSTATTVDVGSYTGSPSPYGTFDQGGNLFEWTETVVGGANRQVRGGAYNQAQSWIAASTSHGSGGPGTGYLHVGFRIASIPEPGSASLLVGGLLCTVALRRRARSARSA